MSAEETVERSGNQAPAESGALTEDDALRCIPGVRALLMRLTRDRETTDDLTQETTMAVIMAIREGRIRKPEALKAYVLQTARNMVTIRARKKEPAYTDEVPEVESVWAERPQTPFEQCEAAQLSALAHQVLAELPTERDQAVMTGYYVHGQSKSELMRQLDMGSIEFNRVISRARGRMRELMIARMSEETDGAVRASARSSVSSSEPRKVSQ